MDANIGCVPPHPQGVKSLGTSHRACIIRSFDALMNASHCFGAPDCHLFSPGCVRLLQSKPFQPSAFRKFRHLQHVQSCRQFVPVPFPFLEFLRNFFRFIAHQHSGSGSDSRTLDKASGLSIVSMTTLVKSTRVDYVHTAFSEVHPWIGRYHRRLVKATKKHNWPQFAYANCYVERRGVIMID